MTVTFVTAFYNLKALDSKQYRIGNKYVHLFRQLPFEHIPFIVIFTDKKSSELIKIDDLIPADKYIIKYVELAEFPDFPKDSKFVHRNRSCQTTNYVKMVHQKVGFLKRAVDANHFDTNLFAWIDFGLFHSGRVPAPKMKEIVNNVKEKMHLASMNPFPDELLLDKIKVYNECKLYINAGFMSGSRAAIMEFHELYQKEYALMEQTRNICLEEQLLAIIAAENPDKVDFYYSINYSMVLRDIPYMTRDIDHYINSIEFCVTNKMYDKGTKIIVAVIDAITKHYLPIDCFKPLLKFIYTSYVCSYYTTLSYQLDGQKLSISLASTLQAILDHLPAYRKHYLPFWKKQITLSKCKIWSYTEFYNSDAMKFCLILL